LLLLHISGFFGKILLFFSHMMSNKPEKVEETLRILDTAIVEAFAIALTFSPPAQRACYGFQMRSCKRPPP
jgi:hypothetical protein